MEKTRSGATAGSRNRKAVVIETRISLPWKQNLGFMSERRWQRIRNPVRTAFKNHFAASLSGRDIISTHAKTKETPKESKYDKERTRCQNRR